MTNRIAYALEKYYKDELYDIITSRQGLRFKTLVAKLILVNKLTTYIFYRCLALPQVDVARFLNLSVTSVYLYVKEIENSKNEHIIALKNKAVELYSYSEHLIEGVLTTRSQDLEAEFHINEYKNNYND